jgi:hypothetical protein
VRSVEAQSSRYSLTRFLTQSMFLAYRNSNTGQQYCERNTLKEVMKNNNVWD